MRARACLCFYTNVMFEWKELLFTLIRRVYSISLVPISDEKIKIRKKNQMNCALADYQSAWEYGCDGVCCIALYSFPNSLSEFGPSSCGYDCGLSHSFSLWKDFIISTIINYPCLCVYVCDIIIIIMFIWRIIVLCSWVARVQTVAVLYILYNSRFGCLCCGHIENCVREVPCMCV